MGINYKKEVITPDLAISILATQPTNRVVRERRVKEFAELMFAGKFFLTHQGIAFDEKGLLLDGQHRLRGVVSFGGPIEMMVARGVPRDTFNAIDRGAKKSMADILRPGARDREKKCVEMAILLDQMLKCGDRWCETPDRISVLLEKYEPLFMELMDLCPTTTRALSITPVRLAAAILSTEFSEAPGLYKSLVLHKVADFTPAMANGYARLLSFSSKSRATVRASAFGIGFNVFYPNKKNNAKPVVHPQIFYYALVKNWHSGLSVTNSYELAKNKLDKSS